MSEWVSNNSIISVNTTQWLTSSITPRVLSPTTRVVIIVTYVVGIFGNLAALYILHRERKVRYRNKKHTLMLRCLAGNDLVGLLGMLIQLSLHPIIPMTGHRIGCGFRVVWRGFGVSSGCVSLVMAFERWLALTHPFHYHKHVTYNSILKAILICWTAVLVLSIMPFFGFGLYYDPIAERCRRYRDGENPVDVAYAYVFFAFGLVLSLGIVWANLTVTRYLCHSGSDGDLAGRRICRSNSKLSSHQRVRVECMNVATPDEMAFGRLMVGLSVTFLLCWLPNLIAIPLAQWRPGGPVIRRYFEVADVLMAIHFTLDPFVYVLLHHYFPCLRLTFEFLQRHCCWRTRTASTTPEESTCI